MTLKIWKPASRSLCPPPNCNPDVWNQIHNRDYYFLDLLMSSTLHLPTMPTVITPNCKLIKVSIISGLFMLLHFFPPVCLLLHWCSFLWNLMSLMNPLTIILLRHLSFYWYLLVFLLVSPKQNSTINKLEFQTTQYFYRGSMKVGDWFHCNAYQSVIYPVPHCILLNNSTFAYSAILSPLQLFQLFYTLHNIWFCNFQLILGYVYIVKVKREQQKHTNF